MIHAIFFEFLTMIQDVLPFFILAIGLSALLETKIRVEKWITPWLTSRFAVVWACLLAAILPGCACATIPLAENLRKSKANLGVTSAFLMVSPLLGPHTLILTYAMLGIEFTFLRLGAALAGGIFLGYLFQFADRQNWIQLPEEESSKLCCNEGCGSSHSHPSFLQAFWITTRKLGGYFLIGILIASVLSVVIPADAIPGVIGTGLLSFIVAALIGIPVYVCEGEEIPITRALLDLNLGAGQSFTFMMGAVGTCIPTILMAKKIIGNRAVAVYVGYWFIFVLASGWMVSRFFLSWPNL